MKANLAYLLYILRHKVSVFKEGRKLGLPVIQLLAHDLSKFSRAEWTPYVDTFFRVKIRGLGDTTFKNAWEHHKAHNPHHWQHWRGEKMPLKYVLEMVADWRAMGSAGSWYQEEVTQGKINLHPETKVLVEYFMREDYENE